MSVVDADWGSVLADRKYVYGHYLLLNNKLIVWWSSKKNQAWSTYEAEYRVVANVVCEILWVVSLLAKLDVKLSAIHIIWCDNTCDVVLTKNLIQHSKMKHVDLDLCFIREKVLNGQVIVNYVPALDEVAEILTKPHTESVYHHFRSKLEVMSFLDMPGAS